MERLTRLKKENTELNFLVSLGVPKLKKVGAESGGIHFAGKSSTGKSTCAVAASSVFGGENYPLKSMS